MTFNLVIGLLFAAVLVGFIWRAFNIVWREAMRDNRGSSQQHGHHIIHANYSGMSAHQSTYKVPCDPQEYARLFIPQKTDKES